MTEEFKKWWADGKRQELNELFAPSDIAFATWLAAKKQKSRVTLSDAQIDRILRTRIPGGSEASHWFLPHEQEKGLQNVRDVVRRMLETAAEIGEELV